ncbi:MAG: family 20 glycosylhydrolase [Planctomycetes bacterium]|nr:family 20 glycosylhydrolase [Planctomycetota bacterium]
MSGMTNFDPVFHAFLPRPRRIERLAGSPLDFRRLRLENRTQDDRIRRRFEECVSGISDFGAAQGQTDETRLVVTADSAGEMHHDGYRLEIAAEGIQIAGGSVSGCFHGVTTLGQLLSRGSGFLPRCRIEDWPDFRVRGLLFDITRGKVPTLATLKHLVDRLVNLKVNQLQLNIEHAFVFKFDPEICSPQEGITPEEARKLDAYCRDRFIDLVPALATLGHMGRVLSMPRYRHLAEVESTKPWDAMTWPERLHGLTLDCANPEAHRLVERMCGDIMDAFPTRLINCTGDEPYDLGEGKNKDRFYGDAKGEAYVDHLRRIYDSCASRGRRVMFWGDVLENYPNLLGRLPSDVTLLHWGYDDSAKYEATADFTATGLDTFVCPGTSGWKRIMNALNLAERNISTFAEIAKRHGACGLLNTDWGDHGHFNQLACSWHGIVLGACKAWRADHPIGADFDASFVRHLWKLADDRGISLLRQASGAAKRCETWRLFWQPLRQMIDDPHLPSYDDAEEMAGAAHEAQALFERELQVETPTEADFAELTIACRFVGLFAEKVRFAHAARSDGNAFSREKKQRGQWAENLRLAGAEFAECWRRRNKTSGLDDVLRALSTAEDDVTSRAF